MSPDDPQALLAQLEPIVTPPPVGFWPPAPGWWVLVLASCVILGVAGIWLLRNRRRLAYQRQALTELHLLRPETTVHYAMQLDALLKRAALHAYPNDAHKIASLHGRQWLDYLREALPDWQPQEAPRVLTESIYRPKPQFDPLRLEAEVRTWLKRHRPARAGRGRHV